MTTEFTTALTALTAALTASYAATHPGGNYPLTYAADKPGKRFVRVYSTAGVGRSAWGFVELATGNVFKSASWKAPDLRYPRGNVYDPASRDELARHGYGLGRTGAYVATTSAA